MKKIIGLFLITTLLNSCDDGDLTQENINFDAVAVQKCTQNSLLYKLNENEALIFDATSINFPTETMDQEFAISPANRVIYRFYNNLVTTATICEIIPPVTPIVSDEWSASAGNIIIKTSANKTPPDSDNGTRITGYSHNITFKNITFSKSNGTQVYETFTFGAYVTSATILPFNFRKILKQCPISKQLFDNNTSEALILDIDPTLIINAPTPLNSPRTGLISNTKNKLTYKLFSGGLLTADYFCKSTLPTTPEVNEEWIAVSGVENVSGIIEVTTTVFGQGFNHKVVIKKAKLKRGNSDFLLGDNYIYGELLTTN